MSKLSLRLPAILYFSGEVCLPNLACFKPCLSATQVKASAEYVSARTINVDFLLYNCFASMKTITVKQIQCKQKVFVYCNTSYRKC